MSEAVRFVPTGLWAAAGGFGEGVGGGGWEPGRAGSGEKVLEGAVEAVESEGASAAGAGRGVGAGVGGCTVGGGGGVGGDEGASDIFSCTAGKVASLVFHYAYNERQRLAAWTTPRNYDALHACTLGDYGACNSRHFDVL